MRLLSIISLILFLTINQSFGQYETVLLNYEKSYFGENQPLPADKYFIVNGSIRNDVQYVEINIFTPKGKDDRTPIYTNYWKRDYNNSASAFNLPVNLKLREGKDHDILLNFYRTISSKERANLTLNIFETLDTYVDQSMNYSNKKIKLMRNDRQTINDLNQIVERGMSLYRSRTLATFPGFSDIVKLKLKQIEDVKLKKADKMEITSDTLGSRMTLRTKLINELKTILHKEVVPYINAEIYVLLDDKYIDNYPTETVRDAYFLAPHFGYGGVATTTKDEFNYGSNMYAGLSVPLAKKSKNQFLSNTSVSFGAFLGKIKDNNDNEYSGPLFNIPTYVSLGYRPFGFFRVQAGAAFLENVTPGASNKIEVRPFVGISAELNVWFNLNKNK